MPTLLYGVETWGPSLNKAIHWKYLERPLVSMIACMIRSEYLQALGSPYGRLFLLYFLVDMQPLVPLKDYAHIYSSKKHELSCGCLTH